MAGNIRISQYTFGVIYLPKWKIVSVVALQSYNFVQNRTEKQFSGKFFSPTAILFNVYIFSTIVLNDFEWDFEGSKYSSLFNFKTVSKNNIGKNVCFLKIHGLLAAKEVKGCNPHFS